MNPDFESLRVFTETNQWTILWPEISLGILALLLLGLEAVWGGVRRHVPILALAGQAVVLALFVWQLSVGGLADGGSYFAGAIQQTAAGDLMRVFFLVSSLFVTHVAWVYLQRRPLARVEYFHVLLVVTACFMLLAQAGNFILLFVALETLTVGLYVLVGYGRITAFSLEAGLKYLVASGFSSALLVFGIALLYGFAGNPLLAGHAADPFNFGDLRATLGTVVEMQTNALHPMALTGAVLVLAGMIFKIGAVPFQIWIPDVYQGAPTPTTAVLAVISKAAGFFLLYLLIQGPFAPLRSVLLPLISMVAGASMIFGNLAALGQTNVKRIMGSSGVAHAGILLMAVVASPEVDWAFGAGFFYLIVYALSSFTVFEVMVHLSPDEDADQDLRYYQGLLQQHPLMGLALAAGLGSLAGIPPLAGFISKFAVFWAAAQAGLWGLLTVALAGVVVSIYYYFGWLRSAVFRGMRYEEIEVKRVLFAPSASSKFLLGALGVVLVFLGLFQGPLAQLYR